MQEMLTAETVPQTEAIPQEVAPTQPGEAQEAPAAKTETNDYLSSPKVKAVLQAYAAEYSGGSDVTSTAGVAELLSAYAAAAEADEFTQSIIVRNLARLTGGKTAEEIASSETSSTESASEQPESNAESRTTPESETTAEATKTPEAPTPETPTIPDAELSRIVDQAKSFSQIAETNITNPDYYELLGIGADHTADVDNAFRNRQREVHPDMFNLLATEAESIQANQEQVAAALDAAGVDLTPEDLIAASGVATAVSQMVGRAKEVLKNPESKATYDWYLAHANTTLDNGQNVFHTYFQMRDDNERNLNKARWQAQIDKGAEEQARKQEATARRQKEQAEWQARREQVRSERKESEQAKSSSSSESPNEPKQEVPRSYRTKRPDFAFDYEAFVRRGQTAGNERVSDFFRNTTQYNRNDAAAAFSQALRGERSQDFAQTLQEMYLRSKMDNQGFVMDFANESDVFTPQEMLLLMVEAMSIPHQEMKLGSVPIGVFAAIAELNNNTEAAPTLSQISEALLNNSQPEGIILTPQELAQTQDAVTSLVGAITQIKTLINVSQVLGRPLPLKQILKLMRELPNLYLGNQFFKTMVLKAVVGEVTNSDNPFQTEDFDDIG